MEKLVPKYAEKFLLGKRHVENQATQNIPMEKSDSKFKLSKVCRINFNKNKNYPQYVCYGLFMS